MTLKEWLLQLDDSEFLEIFNEMSHNTKIFGNNPEDAGQFLPDNVWHVLTQFDTSEYSVNGNYVVMTLTEPVWKLKTVKGLYDIITHDILEDMVQWVCDHDDRLRWIIEMGYRIETDPGYYIVDDGKQLLIKFDYTDYIIGVGPEGNRNFDPLTVTIEETE